LDELIICILHFTINKLPVHHTIAHHHQKALNTIDIIKMDLEKNDVEWLELGLTQNMGKWQAVVNTVSVRWTQTVNVKLWKPMSHSYSSTCCK